MNLAIDIGNTTIGCAVVKKNKVFKTYHISSTLERRHLAFEIEGLLKKIGNKYGRPHRVIVCSVVPNILFLLESAVRMTWDLKPIIVGRDIKVPLKNLYQNPTQVGQDRLVGAYAAKIFFKAPCIVIDLGTAITFDVVSRKGEYLGGVIVPGLRLSLESLHLKTALLPKIKIRAPKAVIGKSTQQSMLSGIFYGYGSLCQGIIELISRQIGGNPKIIMTGGHTHLMKRFIDRKIRILDENLVFKGLSLLTPD